MKTRRVRRLNPIHSLDQWWKSSTVQAFVHSFASGQKIGIMELDRTVFGMYPLRGDLIKMGHEYEESWRKSCTGFSIPLSLTSGSNRKPRPQKGTGRARAGHRKSPHWKGGYKAHGVKPRDPSLGINPNVYRLAMKHALSVKFAQEQLLVVDSFKSIADTNPQQLWEKMIELCATRHKNIYLLYGNPQPERELIQACDQASNGNSLLLPSAAQNVIITPLMESDLVIIDKAGVEMLESMYAKKK